MTGGGFGLPPDVDCRKGEVGGDRGCNAAVALREAEKSDVEDPRRKYRMKMQSAAPTARVVGLVFFRRTGPMVRAMGCVGGAHKREHIEVVVFPVLVDLRVSCCRRVEAIRPRRKG